MIEESIVAVEDDDERREGEFIQSLARGLAVMRAFNEDRREMSLSEIAQVTGLARATVRRFLHTLAELGYVRVSGRLFSLTPRVLDLGYSYLSGLTVSEVAQAHLERLAGQTHESTSLAVLDDLDIVYVARVSTRRIMTVGINIGTRFPAYATSMGRVLLAALPDDELEERMKRIEFMRLGPNTVKGADELRAELARVRAEGSAVVDQELEYGLRSIAVPLRNAAGQTIGAINVSAQAGADPIATVRERYLPLLKQTAAAIERDLASSQSMSHLTRVI